MLSPGAGALFRPQEPPSFLSPSPPSPRWALALPGLWLLYVAASLALSLALSTSWRVWELHSHKVPVISFGLWEAVYWLRVPVGVAAGNNSINNITTGNESSSVDSTAMEAMEGVAVGNIPGSDITTGNTSRGVDGMAQALTAAPAPATPALTTTARPVPVPTTYVALHSPLERSGWTVPAELALGRELVVLGCTLHAAGLAFHTAALAVAWAARPRRPGDHPPLRQDRHTLGNGSSRQQNHRLGNGSPRQPYDHLGNHSPQQPQDPLGNCPRCPQANDPPRHPQRARPHTFPGFVRLYRALGAACVVGGAACVASAVTWNAHADLTGRTTLRPPPGFPACLPPACPLRHVRFTHVLPLGLAVATADLAAIAAMVLADARPTPQRPRRPHSPRPSQA